MLGSTKNRIVKIISFFRICGVFSTFLYSINSGIFFDIEGNSIHYYISY